MNIKTLRKEIEGNDGIKITQKRDGREFSIPLSKRVIPAEKGNLLTLILRDEILEAEATVGLNAEGTVKRLDFRIVATDAAKGLAEINKNPKPSGADGMKMIELARKSKHRHSQTFHLTLDDSPRSARMTSWMELIEAIAKDND